MKLLSNLNGRSAEKFDELSPLICLVLKGLDNCWLEKEGRWSHTYHLDGRAIPNQSRPRSDIFYTLNVLLGLSRLRDFENFSITNLKEVFDRNAKQILTFPGPKYVYGMALWCSAELGWSLPPDVARYIRGYLNSSENWVNLHAQDLGTLLIGVCAQAKFEPREWNAVANRLYEFLDQNYTNKSGLFSDAYKGYRKRFSSFATNTYLAMACYIYGANFKDYRAIALGHSCTQKLIDSQGPQGEWPWFFDAINGQIIDYYEIYSVHQDGMAPALLQLAEENEFGPGATSALKKGFLWILGENQLQESMVVADRGFIYRSQVRRKELRSKVPRIIRATINSTFGWSSAMAEAHTLQVRLECRSYHLGWVVWSFARREDLKELTHHKLFSEPVRVDGLVSSNG